MTRKIHNLSSPIWISFAFFVQIMWNQFSSLKYYEFQPLFDTSDTTRYATASARSDGLLLLCGGRDANSVVSKTIVVAWHLTLFNDSIWDMLSFI